MKPRYVNAGTTETLGDRLERDCLTRKARCIDTVIAALRQQADGQHGHAGKRHILQAITEFEVELAVTNARLGDLAAGATRAPSRRDSPPDWTTT
jgi:hypothetical protein